MNSEDRTENPEGSKNTARRIKRSLSESYVSEGSTRDSSSSSHENQRRRHYQNHSQDEFEKKRPPTFNGEIKNGQEVESWLLGIRKYFQVQDYFGNMKARVAIFNLTGRASIWWEHFRQVKNINERDIVWNQLRKYFKEKYLSDRYYDVKIEEFHELRLGQQTMEEYANRFLELLRYVRYIKYEKVKIQCFLSGLPQSYKDLVEFCEPRTLEEAIRKDKYCY